MEGEKIIYNGKILDASKDGIPVSNRGLLFGDGLFETIKIINGKPCLTDIHFQRLMKGVKTLKFNVSEDFDDALMMDQIIALLKTNNISKGGRCRITVTRAADGYYNPRNSQGIDYIIQAIPLEQNSYELNEEGLLIDIYPERMKFVTTTSNFKTLNSELNIMASMYAQDEKLDDVLLTNNKESVIESSNSNLFLVNNGVLYTVPLTDGCVRGTMRWKVINMARENNIAVHENSFSPRNLLVADEVFLTNAISGVRWVKRYRHRTYTSEMAQRLTDLLNESIEPKNA